MNAFLKDKNQKGDEHDWLNRPVSILYTYIFQNTQVLIILFNTVVYIVTQ